MKHFISLLLALNLVHLLAAQVYVYPDRNILFSDMVCNVQGGHVLPDNEVMWNKAIVTCDERGIYKGFSTSTFDILYTYKEGQLYLGDSFFTSDIMFTFENGVIYRGDSTFPLDRLFTFKNGKLYSSEGESVFDILLSIEGALSVTELFGILLALEMI